MENMRSAESYLRDVQPENIESVLDVGVGFGGIFDFANYEKMNSLKRKICVDIEKIGDNIPQTWGKKICDGCALPFGNGMFDVVNCTEVLGYVEKEKLDLFLTELERVSRDLIYITVSNEALSLKSLEHGKYFGFPGQEFFKLKGYHVLFLNPQHVKCFKRKVPTWDVKFHDMEDYIKMVGMQVGLNGNIDSILDCGTGQKGVVAQDYYENNLKIKKGYACDV
jgi:hypothetical protein